MFISDDLFLNLLNRIFIGFHTFCLNPPLHTIPKGQWFCHTCLFGTGVDFGFDEGEEHSLPSFQARAQAFRKMWFEEHPPSTLHPNDVDDPTVTKIGKYRVSEDDVENEFWRLVQSQHETVEIEYGADVHSTTHGRYERLLFHVLLTADSDTIMSSVRCLH